MFLPDVSGRESGIDCEVGWNKLAEKKKLIRFKVGEHEMVVERDHLMSVLFLLSNEAEREKLISPFVTKTPVTKYTRLIGITTTRNIRKGETINVPLEFTYNAEKEELVIGKGSLNALGRRVV